MTRCIENKIDTIPSFFQIKIDPLFSTSTTDDWVFVHNEAGLLLGAKKFERGETKIFREDNVVGELTITFLRSFIVDGIRHFDFKSYHGDHLHESWLLKSSIAYVNAGSPNDILKIKVVDENLSVNSESAISNRYYEISSGASDGQVTYSDVYVTASVNDYFLFLTDKEGKSFYRHAVDATPGNVTYSLDDFDLFDKYVDFNFPATSNYELTVRGYENNQSIRFHEGYVLGDWENGEKSTIQVGYIDTWAPRSYTFASANYENESFTYARFGSAPDNDVQVTNNITTTIANNTFEEFSVNPNDSFDWYTSRWKYTSSKNSTTDWSVTSSEENFSGKPSIPDVVKKAYPELRDVVLAFDNIQLYSGNKSYDNMIATDFGSEDYTAFELRSRVLKNID